MSLIWWITILFVITGMVVLMIHLTSSSVWEILSHRHMYCTLNKTCLTNTHIPKKIYRVWVSDGSMSQTSDPMTEANKKAWDFTAEHNPDYEQVLITDAQADVIMKRVLGGSVYDTYISLVPGAAKADLLRYAIMYEYGGVYLDMKSGARSLCKLIQPSDRMLVSTWSTTRWSMVIYLAPIKHSRFGEFQQWWLVCCPRHPIIRVVIEDIVRDIQTRKRNSRCQKETTRAKMLGIQLPHASDVLNTTGPWAFTRAVIKARETSELPVRTVCVDGNGVFVYDVAGTHVGGASYWKEGPLLRCDR